MKTLKYILTEKRFKLVDASILGVMSLAVAVILIPSFMATLFAVGAGWIFGGVLRNLVDKSSTTTLF